MPVPPLFVPGPFSHANPHPVPRQSRRLRPRQPRRLTAAPGGARSHGRASEVSPADLQISNHGRGNRRPRPSGRSQTIRSQTVHETEGLLILFSPDSSGYIVHLPTRTEMVLEENTLDATILRLRRAR
jgi:hypothetical protein